MPVRPSSRRNEGRPESSTGPGSRWARLRWLAVVIASLVLVGAFHTSLAHSQAVTSGGYTTNASVSPSVSSGATAQISVAFPNRADSSGATNRPL